MLTDDREQMRRFFCEAWRKTEAGEALEPLEAEVAEVVRRHPEYQALLRDPERTLAADFPPERGHANPFLHMGMHLAIREQLATDRPPGLRAGYRGVVERAGDAHAAEHRIMDCLGEALWRAQRAGRPPDEAAYLDCVRRLTVKV